MRSIILLGLVATLSAASCREIQQQQQHHHHRQSHRVNNAPTAQRLKEVKNKRGVGDFPHFGLPAHSLHHGGFGHQALPNFGGYGAFGSPSPLGLGSPSFGFQPAPTLASFGSNSLANLGQSYQLGQSSAYNLPSSNLNLAGLLQANGQASSYSSPSYGLFSPANKGAAIDFGAQATTSAAHAQQRYTPLYSTTIQLEPSAATPVAVGASQGYGIQAAALNNLGSQGVSLNSLASGNGASYNIAQLSSGAPSGGSSSQAVSGGYVVAAAAAPQPSTSASYNVPISLSVSPASSSGSYALSIPSSNQASHGASSATYQLPVAQAYTALSAGSTPNSFAKFTPASSDGSIYIGNSNDNNVRPYSTALKLANFASPSSLFGGQSQHQNTAHTSSAGSSYAPVQYSSYTAPSSSMPVAYMTIPTAYSSGSNSDPKQSSHAVTSYGTPASHYTIPSTNYGIPSESIQTASNSEYKPQSSSQAGSSANYNSAQASTSYSSSGNAYNAPSSSSGGSYSSGTSYKGQESNYQPSTISFSEPSMNYESSSGSGGSSSDADSIGSYKPQSAGSSAAALSNSIDNYSSSGGASASYERTPDSGSSYSNPLPRYHRYPAHRSPPSSSSAYIDGDDSAGSGSSYDTISYSVPLGKH